VPGNKQARKTVQTAATKYAQTSRFAGRLNLRLPHHFKLLPSPPRTVFFSLAPLFVKESLLFPLFAALLRTRFCHRHRSIIAHNTCDPMSSAGSADRINRKDRFVTLSSSARRLIITNDDPATEPFQQQGGGSHHPKRGRHPL
jgi:hypothetical protein